MIFLHGYTRQHRTYINYIALLFYKQLMQHVTGMTQNDLLEGFSKLAYTNHDLTSQLFQTVCRHTRMTSLDCYNGLVVNQPCFFQIIVATPNFLLVISDYSLLDENSQYFLWTSSDCSCVYNLMSFLKSQSILYFFFFLITQCMTCQTILVDPACSFSIRFFQTILVDPACSSSIRFFQTVLVDTA